MNTIDRAALIELVLAPLFSDEAAANLPVIAKALLAPLRELHHPIQSRWNPAPCACGLDLEDCRTAELLDAIEAEVSNG